LLAAEAAQPKAHRRLTVQERKFELKQIVKMVESEETGTVIGCAAYIDRPNDYLIRYKAADGRQVETWWTESALQAA
jgi:putative transposon-encoded protein